MPRWWKDHLHIDWDFLWENRRRTALLQTPSFSLPHNPRLDDENRESLVCSQDAKVSDKYDEPHDCVDCEFKDDMHHVAVDLFESINSLRNDLSPCDAFYEKWAKRECL